ncbi:uncharacterized protein LOC132736859 [Ruditapes philippinarum]|uniref:uncharacterized protein LOC132736859 n=1 Tax=Ruditapes philippinarum TaxID=129788 RepID=UPI00295A9810|nr:uncharacterized protein LOC132736859 [Ruditapes philippinarum]
MVRWIFSVFIVIMVSSTCRSKGFQARVDSLFRDFERLKAYDGILDCIEVGKSKMISLREHGEIVRNRDMEYAGTLINMYSNPSCSLSKKEMLGVFFTKVNKELRSGRTNGPESSVWREAGILINQALEILGLQKVSVVYRGCPYSLDFTLPQFIFGQITSTTTNPKVAEMYTGCETFILIEDALGVDIRPYSQIPDESEVLLQSTNIYVVEKHTRNKTEIQQEMNKISPLMESQINEFVRLRQKHKNRLQNLFSRLFMRW